MLHLAKDLDLTSSFLVIIMRTEGTAKLEMPMTGITTGRVVIQPIPAIISALTNQSTNTDHDKAALNNFTFPTSLMEALRS